MYEFKNKCILILSPQEWTSQHLSKHHYSIELAKMGNKVLFIDVPLSTIGVSVGFEHPIKDISGLMVGKYQVPLPFLLSFHLKRIYKFINKIQVKRLVRRVFRNVDVVIDFGHYRLFNGCNDFESEVKIFFPVDDFENLLPDMRGAELGLSVSTVIVEKMRSNSLNFHFINHGLSSQFIDFFEKNRTKNLPLLQDRKVKIGYSGNLMIKFLDRESLKLIIEANPEVEFHFFGNYKTSVNEPDNITWYNWLSNCKNVHLYGVLSTNELCEAMLKMDAFMLCYRGDNKNYHAENSHKILEYLITGKPVFSSLITLYRSTDLLFFMDTDNPIESFKSFLDKLIRNGFEDNSSERINFARMNSYKLNLSEIEKLYSNYKYFKK